MLTPSQASLLTSRSKCVDRQHPENQDRVVVSDFVAQDDEIKKSVKENLSVRRERWKVHIKGRTFV